MIIILFGPPGAGKGTQAYKIAKKFNLYKISTGDLLRDEILMKTDLGNKIKSIMDQGTLVSDGIINDLIISVLSNKKFYNEQQELWTCRSKRHMFQKEIFKKK